MYRVHSGHESRVKRIIRSRDGAETRFRVAKAGFLAFGALLILRLFMLQVVDASMYRDLATGQREIYKDLIPERGKILIQDKKGQGLTPLVANKDLFMVYADPRLITKPQIVADQLAPLLFPGNAGNTECPAGHSVLDNNSAGHSVLCDKVGDTECFGDDAATQHSVSCDEYQQLLDRLSKKDDPYEPLAHGVEEAVVKTIDELKIVGIDAAREPVRYYPFKNIGAHLAGFVGSDGKKVAGRYGIEGAFETELAGTPGFFEGEKDVGGRWIPVGSRKLKPAVNGSTVVLTIDRAIEYFACVKLNEAVKKHEGSGGVVIIADVKTGAILAMCGYPDFDPNNYGAVKDISVYSSPATFTQYEPGSVFKVITMAAALDSGAVIPATTYVDTGAEKIGSYTINNSDYKKYGLQTMTQVLEKSLNTGAIFAARQVGINGYRDYIKRFGFGEKTGIDFPPEAEGDISALSKQGEIYMATASFGQGISVSPIQILNAVAAIANQGKLMKPYLISEIRKSTGAIVRKSPEAAREVVSPRTATLLSGMMVSVVENGHGKRAGVPGYYVAGKTGTAQIPRNDGQGYETDTAIGTFVGFAPVENPVFAMLTRIDRPKGVKFAESTAAPLFGEIAKFLLQYFEIKPTRSIP